MKYHIIGHLFYFNLHESMAFSGTVGNCAESGRGVTVQDVMKL